MQCANPVSQPYFDQSLPLRPHDYCKPLRHLAEEVLTRTGVSLGDAVFVNEM